MILYATEFANALAGAEIPIRLSPGSLQYRIANGNLLGLIPSFLYNICSTFSV